MPFVSVIPFTHPQIPRSTCLMREIVYLNIGRSLRSCSPPREDMLQSSTEASHAE